MGFPHFQHPSAQAVGPELFADTAAAREGEQMDPRSFAILYDHMFTGGLPPGDEVTWSLLWAARQFRLQRLALFCEVNLALQVDIQNAAFYLIQSHKFASEHLWLAVLKFVAEALPFVSKTPGWLLLQNHPSLLTEVMDQRVRDRYCLMKVMDHRMRDQSRSTNVTGHSYGSRSSHTEAKNDRKKKKPPFQGCHGPLDAGHFPPRRGNRSSQVDQQSPIFHATQPTEYDLNGKNLQSDRYD